MKTKQPPPPQTYSQRRELFERAIAEASAAHQHLTSMAEALASVAAPVGTWQRDAKRLADVTRRISCEIQWRLRLLEGIDDADEMFDPDEGREPEPEDDAAWKAFVASLDDCELPLFTEQP